MYSEQDQLTLFACAFGDTPPLCRDYAQFDLPSDTVSRIAAGTAAEDIFQELVDYEQRKRRGQFFTPPTIALEMVRWACGSSPQSFLDPAVGPGIFLESLSSLDVRSVSQVTAIDTDLLALALARQRLTGSDLPEPAFEEIDFLHRNFDRKFDAIVCNPPYIRHHDAKLPEEVFRWFDKKFGVRMSRLTNVYGLFLLKILSLLSPTGRAAVITPTEFLNADFGRVIKEILLRSRALKGFVVFDYANSVFDGIVTTATITLLDAASPSDSVQLVRAATPEATEEAFRHLTYGSTSSDGNVSVVTVPADHLDPATKWSTSSFDIAVTDRGSHLRPLRDFARCSRGIATGANSFFALTGEEARQWDIPEWALKPCLTKSAQATKPTFTNEDFVSLRESGKKVLLLDVPVDRSNEVRSYLDLGESLGIHQRFLTRHRNPWYISERRDPADILVTVFGRGNLRFVLNVARVHTLTAFHGIYVRPEYRRFIPFLMSYFHSESFAHLSAAEHRVYGDGLLKFEPKDVERLLVPDLNQIESSVFKKATLLGQAILDGATETMDASIIANIDSLFEELLATITTNPMPSEKQ